MRKFLRLFGTSSVVAFFVLLQLAGVRSAPAAPMNWEYMLLSGSTLIDDCPICDRPSIPWPLRGNFRLRLSGETPLYNEYAIEGIDFTAARSGTTPYTVTGKGTLRIGGEVAITHQLTMELLIDDGVAKKACTFTNDMTASSQRLWPMLSLYPVQSNGTWTQVYNLNLATAPLKEIWFSTTGGFHPAIGPLAQSAISGGDLISMSGRLVARNSRFSAQLGIMPIVPDLGLDAIAIRPGGEMAFSIEQDIFSETIGQLHGGDIISDRGLVIQGYEALTAPFNPQAPISDPGLDALYYAGTNVFYFSVARDFTAGPAKHVIHHGDLLSSDGRVLKTNAELLAKFTPQSPTTDYGLDAVWVWPSGEIWFSTESGFLGPNSEVYGPGDLLSDQGYVVFANLEMLGAFSPIEDRSQFGLDSLFIVSDATPESPPPLITTVSRDPNTGAVAIRWSGKGQVFQVLRSDNASGPYLPVSDIAADLSFVDSTAGTEGSFYQVAQW